MSRPVRSHRRGNYGALFGISAVVLLGFTAIGIDSGWQRVAMTQLHNAADAGSHAGAMELDGTLTGMQNALARAVAVTSANGVHGHAVPIDGGTTVNADGTDNNPHVTFGRFDSPGENTCLRTDGCWTEFGATPSNAEYTTPPAVVDIETTNAVRVDAMETVNTFFASFPFGTPTLGAANFAISRLPILVGEECAFPLSLGECAVTEFMTGAPCGKVMRLKFSDSNRDNAAWSTPVDATGADSMRDMLNDSDDCTGSVENTDLGEDTTRLNNGVVASVVAELGQILGSNGTTGWDTTWDSSCPGGAGEPLASYCDPATQGVCIGSTTAMSTEALCTGAGGTWDTTCPDTLPDCTNGLFLRRDATVFDLAQVGMSCDGTNGNINTSSAGGSNFNGNVAPTGFVSLVIYNVATSPDQYIDAFITCRDEDGNEIDGNNDGIPDAVHNNNDSYFDEDDLVVSIVQ